MIQDEIFVKEEGDAFFRRCHHYDHIGMDNSKIDYPFKLISDFSVEFKSVIDLGCIDGGRLYEINKKFKGVEKLVGVDPSAEAIEVGSKRYPNLELYQGHLAEIPLKDKFDLIITNFVLHWVDRENLYQAVSEINRIAHEGSCLIIGDFLPDFPQKRRYHHLPENKVYTYKIDYPKMFTVSGLWKEVYRLTYNHNDTDYKIKFADSGDRCVCSLLYKSYNNFYHEV